MVPAQWATATANVNKKKLSQTSGGQTGACSKITGAHFRAKHRKKLSQGTSTEILGRPLKRKGLPSPGRALGGSIRCPPEPDRGGAWSVNTESTESPPAGLGSNAPRLFVFTLRFPHSPSTHTRQKHGEAGTRKNLNNNPEPRLGIWSPRAWLIRAVPGAYDSFPAWVLQLCCALGSALCGSWLTSTCRPT